ncbi:MAG: diguanylate cyclase [Pseudomonadales bacterium]|nr:diguanylate cyclase [Pseudomonadales bacterium]
MVYSNLALSKLAYLAVIAICCAVASVNNAAFGDNSMRPASTAVALSIDPFFKQQQLGLGIEYRIAASNEEAPAEAMSADGWNISDQDSLSFGFSPEARWIRFGLNNRYREPQHLILEIANPYLDYIDVYLTNPLGEVEKHTPLGDQYKAYSRPIRHADFLAPLAIPEKSTRMVLLRVQTISTTRIPIQIWNEEHYIEASFKAAFARSMLYGFFLAISVYHLFLFFSVRDKAYLYYSASVVGMLCVSLSLSGMPTALVWPGLTTLGDFFIMFGICCTLICSAQFTKCVLNLEQYPKFNGVMNFMLGLGVVLFVATFVAPYQVVLKIGLVSALVHAILLMVIYFVFFLRRYQPAQYVLSAIIVACIGIIINILTNFGTIPSSAMGANAAAIGMAFCVILYAFALSNRMNLDRALREEAQTRLAQDLDLKVRERTDELKSANEKLVHASTTDGLTQLMNRRYFDEVYTAEYRRAYRQKQPIAVLMMDIDYFKKLNDTYGHQFGDLCLQEVTKTIAQCLNRPPDICARYGGEEFVVVLPNTPLEGAVTVGKIINERVAAHTINNSQHSVNVTLSIGIAAEIPESLANRDRLIKAADGSLYQAKENGRDQVAYEA